MLGDKEKIGFGIIGCGMVAPAHADSLMGIEEARLVAVCDKDVSRAKAFGEKYGCVYYADVKDLLSHDDIHIVNLCIPPGLHRDVALLCAEAGKHLIVEKPIEVSLKKADDMIVACEQAGVQLAVIFQGRFKKAMIALKKAVERGTLGRLVLGDAYIKWFRPQSYYDSSPWRGTWAMDGGGAIINQSIHTIDQLQWMMGPVESLYARMATYHTMEAEDLAVAHLQFKNGALGVIEGATVLYPGIPERLEVHGLRGTIALEGGKVKVWDIQDPRPEDEPGDLEEESGTGASDPMAFPIIWHQAQIRDMIEAVREGRPAAVDGREGRKALEIVRAIYRSARTGEVVSFPLEEE